MSDLASEQEASGTSILRRADDEYFLAATATDIVCAYVSANKVPAAELPGLIDTVFKAIRSQAGAKAAAEVKELVPAVPVEKSVTEAWLICLEDGKKFKSLKRHLRDQYDMTPEQYRLKWNLPGNYPMVAPEYSKRRAAMAKEFGLGRKKDEAGKDAA